MQFEIRALNASGELQTLMLEAENEAHVAKMALAREISVLSVQSKNTSRIQTSGAFKASLFAEELRALLSAGLNLPEALQALAEQSSQANKPQAARAQSLLATINEGKRFSQALHSAGDFSPLLIGMVEAAEQSGQLPQALSRYAEHENRLHTLKSKIISACIYPFILLVVGGAVVLFLLGYVVPRFAGVYQGTGRALPWASRILLDAGAWIGAHTTGLLITLGAVFIGLIWQFSTQQKRWLNWLTTHTPFVAPRARVYELARLYLTLGTLLSTGTPIMRALGMARQVLPASYQRALDFATRQIESGVPLSQAFEAHGLGTQVALRLLRVGEQAGKLPAMLETAGRYHDAELARSIERFSKIFEPVLMAAIGLMVGLIVVLLYMPIFELAGSLSP